MVVPCLLLLEWYVASYYTICFCNADLTCCAVACSKSSSLFAVAWSLIVISMMCTFVILGDLIGSQMSPSHDRQSASWLVLLEVYLTSKSQCSILTSNLCDLVMPLSSYWFCWIVVFGNWNLGEILLDSLKILNILSSLQERYSFLNKPMHAVTKPFQSGWVFISSWPHLRTFQIPEFCRSEHHGDCLYFLVFWLVPASIEKVPRKLSCWCYTGPCPNLI